MIPKIGKSRAISPSLLVLFLLLFVYATFFISYGLQKHFAFQTAGFDLGNYEQAMWNTVRGYPLKITTVKHISSRWQAHLEPTLLLFVPIYALFSFPHTLIILQTVIVLLGSIPIFFLARQELASTLAGYIFSSVYLFFPALQGALVFDFHAVTLASTFLSAALWFLTNRQYQLVTVMLLLAMGCREDIALLVFLMGSYIWLIQHQRRWGWVIMGLGALWFGTANFVIIPLFSPAGENIHLTRYGRWGASLGQVIGNLLLHPIDAFYFVFSGDRLRYWARLTMPVAFMALLDPLTLLMALPVMTVNTLSSYPPTYQLDQFHYSVVIVPFVVVASINGLSRLIRFAEPKFQHIKPGFLRTTLLVMIFFVTVIYQTQFGHTPIGRYFTWPIVTEHHHRAETMLAQIPSQAAVAAQNNLIPRLSRRESVFTLPKLSHQGIQANYIAIDVQGSIIPYQMVEEYCSQVNEFVTSSEFGLIFAEDGLLLFKRGAVDIIPPDSLPPCPLIR